MKQKYLQLFSHPAKNKTELELNGNLSENLYILESI
jgi:hypothetical protein